MARRVRAEKTKLACLFPTYAAINVFGNKAAFGRRDCHSAEEWVSLPIT